MLCPFCQNGGLDFMCNLQSVNNSCSLDKSSLVDGPVVVTLRCMLPIRVSSLCLRIACLAAIMLPNIQHRGKIYFNSIVMII